MRIPSWILVAAAVAASFPFGWGVGVGAACLLVGAELGVFPVLTIIPSIIGAIAFAVSPVLTPGKRLAILVVGTGFFILLASFR